MEQHGEQLYRFILGIVRNRDLAEDVRQQVYLEAFRDLERYEHTSDAHWLFGVARNRAIDAARREQRWNRGRELFASTMSDAEDPVAERAWESHKLGEIVRRCLERLTPAVREAVTLRHTLGMRFEAMSEVLGERAGTLQRRVARAMPVLRKCVKHKQGEPS